MRQPYAFIGIAVLVAQLAMSFAHAQGPGCESALTPESTTPIAAHEELVIRDFIQSEEALKSSSQKASGISRVAFEQYTSKKLAGLDPQSDEFKTISRILTSVDRFTQSDFFSHALSRSLTHLGAKDFESARVALNTLRTRATQKEKLEFISLVMDQINAVGEDAMRLLDRDLMSEAVAKYGASQEEILQFVDEWAILQQNDFSGVQVALLDYLNVIPAEEVERTLNVALESGRAATLEENMLSMHLVQGYTVQDLAQNKGPISQRKFTRQLALLKAKAFYRGIYLHMRYPKALTFIFIGSFVPTIGVHVWMHDWNITNTLATLIGGLVTCPPLISELIVKKTVTPVKVKSWVMQLTLKQLNDLEEYLIAHPKSLKALDFEEEMPEIRKRIQDLRKIRNVR